VDLSTTLDAARAGDDLAFADIYRDLQPRLLRYASGLVGTDAEDITAEAWLQIARDVRGFEGAYDAFRGWAVRIVRNRALDHIRARGRRPADPTDLQWVLDRADADDAWTMTAERISTREAIALIASLPRDQAEAVLLRTAEILGKRPGALRIAAHRGLKTLADQLAPHGRHVASHRD
jgi:RNA polymerase sigma-70 factor (ECF subfamily)